MGEHNGQYYILKRDLYECPDHQGYTGIRDKAGVYHLGQAAHADFIGDKYVKGFFGHYAIPVESGPEFTGACFDDLARDHLKSKVADLETRLEKAEANDELSDVRAWFHYPIIMPITAGGQGPATVGKDAADITFEVWDQLLLSHASFDNLPDAINEAMRLNRALKSTNPTHDQRVPPC